MRAIDNFANVQANTGEFARPTAGGYIVELLAVKNVPLNEQTGKGDYLKIDYDICHGEFAGYYTKQNERFGGNWFANFIRSYKETAAGMFKHFINCVEESNAGYKWAWDEKSLVHKYVGVVLGEEEYKNSAGEIKTKLVVSQVKTVDEIKNGNFKIPAPKKLVVESSTNDFAGFTPIEDDDLPF